LAVDPPTILECDIELYSRVVIEPRL